MKEKKKSFGRFLKQRKAENMHNRPPSDYEKPQLARTIEGKKTEAKERKNEELA